MASSLASTWRSFWHSMVSNDRHASHDSPYRTGQHVPLAQSRHAPLTSVATSAFESRTDLPTSYGGQDGMDANTSYGHSAPYSPGLRSAMARQSSDSNLNSGEIQMQNFSEGLPPPPPVSHSWKRIDRWAEDNYEELFDQLCDGCTQNDVNDLEHQLDCTLPMDVRESLQIHDGQERGGLPTGIIFGCMLLDCEEIVQEWQNWRTVNEEYLTQRTNSFHVPQPPNKAFAGASSSSTPPPPPQQSGNPLWRQDLLARQDSQPPNAVQKAYAHPAWIPLARDWGGNCIAVDLAPGPSGKWGQVIIFGRDYDCKYVVARSWGAFLANVADDLSQSDKVHIDEETGALQLREFKRQNVEPPYLEILRWRCDQKYGRKNPKRRPASNLRINSNVGGSGTNGISPYGSPTMSATEDRGRSPHRFPAAKGPAASPRAHVSSPLARVATADEAPKPVRVHTDIPPVKGEKLVSIDTPRFSGDLGTFSLDGASEREEKEADLEKQAIKGAQAQAEAGAEMKTVEI